MTRLVGLKTSDYRDRPTDRIFEDNSGQDITTDGVLEGVRRTTGAFSGRFAEMMTASSMFVREADVEQNS